MSIFDPKPAFEARHWPTTNQHSLKMLLFFLDQSTKIRSRTRAWSWWLSASRASARRHCSSICGKKEARSNESRSNIGPNEWGIRTRTWRRAKEFRSGEHLIGLKQSRDKAIANRNYLMYKNERLWAKLTLSRCFSVPIKFTWKFLVGPNRLIKNKLILRANKPSSKNAPFAIPQMATFIEQAAVWISDSVTIVGDFLHFEQLFNAFWNN